MVWAFKIQRNELVQQFRITYDNNYQLGIALFEYSAQVPVNRIGVGNFIIIEGKNLMQTNK